MSSEGILVAMTDISSEYIISAQRRLGYCTESGCGKAKSSKRMRNVRKIAILAAVMLLALTMLFTTAFAASDEFRDALFGFLRIKQEQPVSQEDTTESEDPLSQVGKIDIGEVMEGTYLRLPLFSHASNGVFSVCTDENFMNQGNHYDVYALENGEFIKLEEHYFNQDYTLYGHEIHIEFSWCEHNGEVHFNYVDPDIGSWFRFVHTNGSSNEVLFTLLLDSEDFSTNYPVLIDLHTGELTDFLAGSGVEKIKYLRNIAANEDMSKLLLYKFEWKESPEEIYYLDLAKNRLYRVDELSGEHADACSLLGNALVCWSLTEGKFNTAGTYRAWRIDLATLERTELFEDMPDAADSKKEDSGIVFLRGFNGSYNYGHTYTGSVFALMVDQAQNIFVFDLDNGEKYLIDGLRYTNKTQFTPCMDGKKLIIRETGEGETFGILDFGKMEYLEVLRINESGGKEILPYWFDENTVVICADEENESGSRDCYIYSLLP